MLTGRLGGFSVGFRPSPSPLLIGIRRVYYWLRHVSIFVSIFVVDTVTRDVHIQRIFLFAFKRNCFHNIEHPVLHRVPWDLYMGHQNLSRIDVEIWGSIWRVDCCDIRSPYSWNLLTSTLQSGLSCDLASLFILVAIITILSLDIVRKTIRFTEHFLNNTFYYFWEIITYILSIYLLFIAG